MHCIACKRLGQHDFPLRVPIDLVQALKRV
jgi:hypothetical protein